MTLSQSDIFTWYFNTNRGIFWVRIFRYGIAIEDRTKIDRFDERYGFKKFLRFGKWRLEFLKGYKI